MKKFLIIPFLYAIFFLSVSCTVYNMKIGVNEESEDVVYLIPFGENRILQIKSNEPIQQYDVREAVLTLSPFCNPEWETITVNINKIMSMYPILVILGGGKYLVLTYINEVCQTKISTAGSKDKGNIYKRIDNSIVTHFFSSPVQDIETFTFANGVSASSTIETSLGIQNYITLLQESSFTIVSYESAGNYYTKYIDSSNNVFDIPTGQVHDSIQIDPQGHFMFCEETGRITSYDKSGTSYRSLHVDDYDVCYFMSYDKENKILGGSSYEVVVFWDLSKNDQQIYYDDYNFVDIQHIASFNFKSSGIKGFAVSGYYFSAIIASDPCYESCEDCSGPDPNQCITCKNGLNPVDGICCLESEFFDGSCCVSCPSKCAACTAINKCTKCKKKSWYK